MRQEEFEIFRMTAASLILKNQPIESLLREFDEARVTRHNYKSTLNLVDKNDKAALPTFKELIELLVLQNQMNGFQDQTRMQQALMRLINNKLHISPSSKKSDS